MDFVRLFVVFWILIIGNLFFCVWGFFKKKNMKYLITINTIVSIVTILFMSLIVSGLIKMYEGSYYSFQIPFFVHVTTIFLFSLGLLAVTKTGHRIYIGNIVNVLNGTLFLTAIYVLSKWPGGDDGPGMAWGIFIIPSCFMSLLIAIFGIVRNYQLMKKEVE